MKTINTLVSVEIENSQNENNLHGYADVVVYNEMAEHTSVRITLLEQIRNQMNQLEEMSARRQFVMKELMCYFSK
ncbi:MAG: hypothetical protein WA160_15285 [Pseudobdellovibrio sp.]